jgi:hypothetical protein
MTTMATVETVGELGQRLSRAVLTPVSPGCDEVRRVHNGLVDKRPAVIARCLNTADVVDAVTFGRERGLELSVQAPRSTSASAARGARAKPRRLPRRMRRHRPKRALRGDKDGAGKYVKALRGVGTGDVGADR